MGQCLSANFHLQNWNEVAHMPFLEEGGYYTWWWIAGYFIPLYGILIFLFDILSGALWPLCYIPGSADKAVVITGCDSGFGRMLVGKLTKRGYKVYAGCLTDAAMEELKTEPHAQLVTPIKLDVTKQEQVFAMAAQVEKENPDGIWALVNNAGVSRSGFVDWMSMDDFRFCMEINFFSVISVTKAFLPSLKKSKGRVVIMSSSSAVTCGYCLTSAYSSSKHAVELFASTLRQEMKPWGVTVSTMNPGFHKTGINTDATKIMKGVWDKLPEFKKEQYGEDYLKATCDLQDSFTKGMVFPARHVVKAYVHAITSTRPRVQYRVGVDAKFIFPWTQIFPLRIGELITYYASTNKGMRKIAKPYAKYTKKAEAEANSPARGYVVVKQEETSLQEETA